ncbi:hypothetical protein L227DRAFT_386022 [Lentinus tigrinus ALCF2SS1-6]|uniref:Uncharacterized protein n=1 Tax=Lentinus tigrinus ALCF2SS1-6 TaxID=1328759 RepID=A0A5C2SJ70_9APHY|nr:hypothetical protein L227DRAFT_386022 [Lentinus tigrinus ALCF2SS1-6]
MLSINLPRGGDGFIQNMMQLEYEVFYLGIPLVLFGVTGVLAFIDPSVKDFRSVDYCSSLEDRNLVSHPSQRHRFYFYTVGRIYVTSPNHDKGVIGDFLDGATWAREPDYYAIMFESHSMKSARSPGGHHDPGPQATENASQLRSKLGVACRCREL